MADEKCCIVKAASDWWCRQDRISAAERAVIDAAVKWESGERTDYDYEQALRDAVHALREARR